MTSDMLGRPRRLPVLTLLFASAGLLPSSHAQVSTPQEASAAVGQYCATCHSAQVRTADVVLEPAAAAQPQADPATWEKALRKLRGRSMPPQGAPRPDEATYQALTAYLETKIDQAAASSPNPGKLPLLHRLTRTEYQNTIRDLLAIENLPKEFDYSLLLPPDNSSSGFDNIAELLFVSPTVMESYLNAAEKISRLAVGDPDFPVMVNQHRIPDEIPQIARVRDLPLGTRGGLAVDSYFPLDAEYVFHVDFVGGSDMEQQLEITVDGERVQLATVEPTSGSGRRRAAPEPVEFHIPVKAGPRQIGVTFIRGNEARNEEVMKLHWRAVKPEVAVELVTISGPYNSSGPGNTPSRQLIFTCTPESAAEEEPCARRILGDLARRAYRRPVKDQDIDPLIAFYNDGRTEGGFEQGVQRSIRRLLVSPQFLFRIERDRAGAAPGTIHPVSDLELASRLSYFLWSSTPDDELLGLASAGKLREPGVLKAQVQRMLADSRSAPLVGNFAEQWLYLRDLEAKRPNEILFADFDESLREGFRTETVLFLNSVLREGRSVLDLLSADYTFLNERVAKHYGIPNVHGSHFRRVSLPPGSPRGGLLGQGSILTITSYANRTSPVNRGKWVLENLLSAAPPPPPADIPALKTEDSEGGAALTMREAMVQHRANPACYSCHAHMDPIGFAMENFDGIGRWRTRDGELPIDASGTFLDGSAFDGMAELKQALLRHPKQFVSTVAERLLMYAIGRNVQYFDQPAVRAIVEQAERSNYGFESLVLGVIESTPFQMRQVSPAAGENVASNE